MTANKKSKIRISWKIQVELILHSAQARSAVVDKQCSSIFNVVTRRSFKNSSSRKVTKALSKLFLGWLHAFPFCPFIDNRLGSVASVKLLSPFILYQLNNNYCIPVLREQFNFLACYLNKFLPIVTVHASSISLQFFFYCLLNLSSTQKIDYSNIVVP